MSDCTDKTKPISGASREVTLGVAPLTIAALLAAATPSGSVSPLAKRITISFDVAPAGVTDPIARIARDGAFVLTDTKGERIIQASKVALSEEQFPALMRARVGTIAAFVEQFEVEA